MNQWLWQDVLECAALRRDAKCFYTLVRTVPLLTHSRAHYLYCTRLFDDVVHSSKTVSYTRNRSFHRADGPAVEYEDGARYWYRIGRLHRENGEPAIVEANGDLFWFVDGLRHRTGGPAAMTRAFGLRWYQHDVLHRDDGPAEMSSYMDTWYTDGIVVKEIIRNVEVHYDWRQDGSFFYR